MGYGGLIEIVPALLLWKLPFLALGFAIFLLLVLFAWRHTVGTPSETT